MATRNNTVQVAISADQQKAGATELECKRAETLRRLKTTHKLLGLIDSASSFGPNPLKLDISGLEQKKTELTSATLALQGVLLTQIAMYDDPIMRRQERKLLSEVSELSSEAYRRWQKMQGLMRGITALQIDLNKKEEQLLLASTPTTNREVALKPMLAVQASEPDAMTEIFISSISKLKPQEQGVMLNWLRGLLKIADSNDDVISKAYDAIVLTLNADTLWGIIKAIALKLKEVGWDDRSTSGRFGIGSALAGLALFGGHGAGIAALGGAIGVPLWVVLGGGGLAIGAVIEEFSEGNNHPPLVKIERQEKGYTP